MAVIDYSTGPRVVNEGSHVVYTKATWGAAWTAQPNLQCVECQWNAAPNFNTAILRWEIGSVVLPGDTSPTVFGPWVGRGQFVRVDWTCDNGSILIWTGYIDASDWPTEAFGAQSIVCYGLERALAKTPMADAVWRDGDPTDTAAGTARRSQYPLTFGNPDGLRSFNPVDTGGSVYAFASPKDDGAKPWSTREAVRYLMTYHLPTSSHGVAAVPWSVDQIDQLPDWDQVQFETRNRTVWDVLTYLIRAEQQLGFTVGSDGTNVYLRCFTHLASTLTIGSQSIAANPNQHSVIFAPDALTNARLRDVGGGYDQLICRGARQKTICTLRFADSHLEADWSAAEQDDYDFGDSADAGYAAADDAEKKQRNAIVRGRQGLQHVYRRLKIADDWDFKISGASIFNTSADGDNEFPRSIALLNRLPIKPGIDWDGAVSEDDFDRDGEGRPLLLTWDNPTALPIDRVDNAALNALSLFFRSDIDFSYAVRPSCQGRKIDLQVIGGGPQHMIAKGEFTPLPAVDTDGQLDYREMQATVAIAEDRYVQGVYPSTAPTADIVRRLVMDFGETYHRVRIHPGTVTEVGNLLVGEKTSTGGVLVDDTDELQALAEMIAKSLLLTRKTVSWSSTRKIATVAVGDLITTAAGATVGAPVVAIHMRAPVGIDQPADPSVQSFEVWQGNANPIDVLRRLGGIAGDKDLRTELQVTSIAPRSGTAVRGERLRRLKQR